MKKTVIMVMLVALMMVMTAAVANAAIEPYYHGDFATDTTGCAKCHVTHAGDAAALLIDGPTQTDFCKYCHSNAAKSPYNTWKGEITTLDGFIPSVAGGFETSFNFDTGSTAVTNDGSADASYLPISSIHGVETFDNNDWTSGTQIPGGAGASDLVGNFRCGSCHDPHAGGAYTTGNGSVMPRLLKRELPAWGSAVSVAAYDDWTFTFVGNSYTDGAVAQFKTSVTSGYGDSAGAWCAGCHDLFNRTEADAGQHAVNDASGVVNKYMHRMNFTIDTDAEGTTAIVNKSVYKIALSVNSKLTCLTCHRAHGTSATVTNDPVFLRAATYKNSLGGTSSSIASTVLLREKNRNVCYDCHGAAAFNKPSQQTTE